MLRARPARSPRLIFLPYLSGERTPHNDAEAQGMLAGPGPSTALMRWSSQGWRASPCSPTASIVLDAAGARPVRPLLVGGGARSAYWGQMIADVTGLTIDLAAGAEAGAALGAARLGTLAAGAGSVEAVCPRPPIQRDRPGAERAAAHAARLRRALQGGEGRAALARPAASDPERARLDCLGAWRLRP